MHLTQVIHEAIFSEDDILKRVKLLLSRSPSTQLQENDVGGIVYVDDSGCCGLREGAINRSHERYLRRVEELGLAAHDEKSHFAQKEDIKLGFRVDGIGVVVENREDRWVLLRRALRRAEYQRRMHGNALEVLLGHAASQFVIWRLFFSLFGLVYEELEVWRSKGSVGWLTLSEGAAAEFGRASRMMRLLRRFLKTRPCTEVGCSDSADTHWCYGSTSAT